MCPSSHSVSLCRSDSTTLIPTTPDGLFVPMQSSDIALHTVWTIHVRTMAGDALTLPCPQGALTSIGHVKALVHSQRPNWLVASQRLMLPPGDPAASAVAVDIEQNYMPLDDHCTLQQCGIVDGASLELLMIDTEWSESDLALQASMTSGATELDFSCRFLELNHQGAASIAWSLQYEPRPELTTINLSFNRIGELGAFSLGIALQTNASLQCLNLAGNRIGDDGARALADVLLVNTALQTLDLGENSIGDRGSVLLGKALCGNATLQRMALANNRIGDVGAVSLGAALHCNGSLEVLDLMNNVIDDGGAQSIGDALLLNSCLRVLNMEQNVFGTMGAASLCRALRSNARLEELLIRSSRADKIEESQSNVLNNPSWSQSLCACLAPPLPPPLDPARPPVVALPPAQWGDALGANTALQRLHLKHLQLETCDVRSLRDGLLVNACLQHLDLGGNRLGLKGIEALCTALRVNKTLLRLRLTDSDVGDNGAKELSDALCGTPKSLFFCTERGACDSLQELCLESNGIGQTGAAALGAALSVNTSLQRLSLNSNWIRVEGFSAIAAALGANSSLTQVDLNCTLKIYGDLAPAFLSLGQALAVNVSITELRLEHNYMGPDSCEQLCAALRANTTLQSLYLGENQIGARGAASLADVLGENHSHLVHLFLAANGIGDEGAVALSGALHSNTHLASLDLACSDIRSDAAVASLCAMLRVNTSLRKLNVYLNPMNRVNPNAALLHEAASASRGGACSVYITRPW